MNEHFMTSSDRFLGHVRYMLSPVRLSSVVCHSVLCRLSVCLSVCLSSVTLVHTTQAVQIFGNICTAFGTLAIH